MGDARCAMRDWNTQGRGANAMACVRIIPRSPRAEPAVLLRPGIDRMHGPYEKGARLLTDASPSIVDSLIS